jgi:hypothetical protein
MMFKGPIAAWVLLACPIAAAHAQAVHTQSVPPGWYEMSLLPTQSGQNVVTILAQAQPWKDEQLCLKEAAILQSAGGVNVQFCAFVPSE